MPFELASASCGSSATSALYPCIFTAIPSRNSKSMKLLETPGAEDVTSCLRLLVAMVLPCVPLLARIRILVKPIHVLNSPYHRLDDTDNFSVFVGILF